MTKLFKGVMALAFMTGITMGLPNGGAVIAQAPTQSTIPVNRNIIMRENNQLELLAHVMLSDGKWLSFNQILFIQQEADQKFDTLKVTRIPKEKIQAERHRRKKRKAEKNRRKEIKACSIAAGEQKVLERIVEAEAGGEDYKGRLLVANVILNRVKHKEFPSSIKGVVFSHRGSRYQFSPISNGSYYSVTVSKGTKKAVKAALQGKDPSRGALYFMERAYADSNNARWFDRELTRLFRYGCHEFFK